MMILLIDELTKSEPIFKGINIVFREQLALIYWELYLEDFGFNEEMFILK